MALTNRDQVGRALDLLQQGLAMFIQQEVDSAMRRGRVGPDALRALAQDESQARSFPEGWDAAALLNAIWQLWDPVFRFPLGPAERSLVAELRKVRNRWAHQQNFTGDEAFRALDSVALLLQQVKATQAAELGPLKDELLRRRYEERARVADQRRKRRERATRSDEVAGLVAWREVITPHDDVLSGRYEQAEFAADLHAVHQDPEAAGPEYADPQGFFRRTHLTGGLRALLTGAARRLAGAGGDPVVDLQTNFGGGKTHSMLALYHLFSGAAVSELPGVGELLAEAGAPAPPSGVRRVVLVGNRIAPASPIEKSDGVTVHTLWGEIAWQLGGKAAYERVRADDENATNPGAALGELLRDYGPCLILIDEWVAYARDLRERAGLPAGSFDTQFTFAQNLTESVKTAKNALLVISLPASGDAGASSDASDEEVGGERGREALGRLRNVLGRVASSWRPATAEEGFEIVRRRLFRDVPGHLFKHRDQTARRFAEHYRQNPGAFPAGCGEAAYRERIEAAYPIHPEVFDRLYEDWASLLRFQRTRGVLRLMAGVIHELWSANDQSPLILPGMIPLDPGPVRSELLRYLGDPWDSILDQDVDADDALPERIDEANVAFGRAQAARRAARVVFFGSAPKQRAAQRGIEARRVRLGCAVPGQKPAVYGDALRQLVESATFLYEDGSRVWYDTQPTVAKLARDRAEELRTRPDEVAAEVVRRLREAARERGVLAGVHPVPRDSADVPDERRTRLVILAPEFRHTRGGGDSPARKTAADLLQNRGTQPRQYQNTLLFLAADEARFPDLDEATRRYLAWDSVVSESEKLNLAPSQKKQAENRKNDAERRVAATLPEGYCWLLAPKKKSAAARVRWEEVRLRGGGDGPVAGAAGRAVREELLITSFGPSVLRQLLDSVPLWEGNHVDLRKLADYFAGLLELPRLAGPEVLAETITRGLGLLNWKQDGFAFAEAWDEEEERYRGLSAGAAFRVGADSAGLLVRPDAVPPPEPKPDEPVPTPIPSPVPTPVPVLSDPPAPQPRRYHASATLDAGRLGPDAARVAEEVVSHLAGLERATVRVTLEIDAERADGFPEQVVRVVRENGQTLGFRSQGFEDD